MKATATEIDDKVDELLVCLNEDSRHIEQSLSRLNELRRFVIKRDDTGLGRLLESIQAESGRYRSHELKRQSIRGELARTLGCSLEQMTLSALEAILPEAKRARVSQMRATLRTLIEELKKEHLSTALLLSECARFNNLLLKSIFDLGQTGTVYYNSNGRTKRQTDTAFVNLQF